MAHQHESIRGQTKLSAVQAVRSANLRSLHHTGKSQSCPTHLLQSVRAICLPQAPQILHPHPHHPMAQSPPPGRKHQYFPSPLRPCKNMHVNRRAGLKALQRLR